MRIAFAVIGALYAALFVGHVSPLSGQTGLISSENRFFEIVGEDNESVRYVNELSSYVVETGSRYLDANGLDFPQQILINLRPERFVDFEGDFKINVGRGGFVTLDFRWTRDLDLETACQAISQAFLVRYALYNYGPQGVDRLPYWPSSAIGTMTYLRLRPALWGAFARSAESESDKSLRVMVGLNWSEAAPNRSGYWLMHSLGELVSVQSLRQIFELAVSGRATYAILEELIGEQISESESANALEAWWRDALLRLPEKGMRIFEEMETSREWIQEFSSFELNGEPINLRKVWELRDDVDFRPILEARYELLRIRITRVNPAYFNAARSLGALFETVLDGGAIYEYVSALTVFLSDFEDIKRLEQVVKENLSGTRISE